MRAGSGQLDGCLGTIVSQPLAECAGLALNGDVEWRLVAPADPVDVGATAEEILGDGLLVLVRTGSPSENRAAANPTPHHPTSVPTAAPSAQT